MRLIDADKMIDNACKESAFRLHLGSVHDAHCFIMDQPTVDPVKHGHWITDDCDAQCSVCKQIFTFEVSMHECHPIDDLQMYYCQHCGAKMDEEVSE